MSIKTIELTNFKSFNELKIDLDMFNVLIGANASGKSNFIQVFRFIRDIGDYGLENAIWAQGGVEYLRNINLGSTKNFSLKIHCKTNYEFPTLKSIDEKPVFFKLKETTYEIALEFHKTRQNYKIVKDELSRKFELFLFERKNKKRKNLGKGKLIQSKIKKEITVNYDLPKIFREKPDDIFFFLTFRKLDEPANTPLIESPISSLFPFTKVFSRFAIYDIDPKLPKKAVPLKGITRLEEDGENLSIALNYILKNKKKERKFSSLIKDFLPFVNKINIDQIADKSMLFKISETYFQNRYFPATFVSDGTIHIIALIIILFFMEKTPGEVDILKIIEEPDRNIHPHLISKVIDAMKNASEKSQIIVTTHNPEIVRYTDLKNILLVNRDKAGFSNISRPTEKKEIKRFLKNDIGIEELYIRNLLEI